MVDIWLLLLLLLIFAALLAFWIWIIITLPQAAAGEMATPSGTSLDALVLGDTGPTGVTGFVGPNGLQGQRGDTGEEGATGERGDTGYRGATGKQGGTGPTGRQGTSFHVDEYGVLTFAKTVQIEAEFNPHVDSFYSFLVIDDERKDKTLPIGISGDMSGYIVFFDHLGWHKLAEWIGPTGKQGVRGPTGPTALIVCADTGATGERGSTGPTGLGITGPSGISGIVGTAGTAGFPSTVTGITGPAGSLTGATGGEEAVEAWFGDGEDGDAVISVPTTLTRDMYFNNLTLSSTLMTNGFRVFVKNLLTLSGTTGATGVRLQNNGGHATGASGVADFGTGAAWGTLGGGFDGGQGGLTAGNPGHPHSVYGDSVYKTHFVGPSELHLGGTGGLQGPTGSSDPADSLLSLSFGEGRDSVYKHISTALKSRNLATMQVIVGGSGGGGRGGDGITSGGGGGGGGGVVMLVARIVSGIGQVQALGGDSSFGGGGGGGIVIIITSDSSGWIGPQYDVRGGTAETGFHGHTGEAFFVTA